MDINDLNKKLHELKEPYLKTIPVLENCFVRLVDFMGSDQRIVQAARVSYGEGTKTVREDKGLIDYLLRHEHTSPFEQVEFTFHIRMPIFVARQKIRHRTASANEISGRYSVMKDECYVPATSRMQTQSEDNKQGSSNVLINDADVFRDVMQREQQDIFGNYQSYLDSGMARELARINLPLSTLTEFYWKIDLLNLMKYLRLRMDSHAQYEIRVFAQAEYDLIKPIVPYTCESFERHMLNGARFSQDEIEILRYLVEEDDEIQYRLEEKGWKKSKIKEFLDKL